MTLPHLNNSIMIKCRYIAASDNCGAMFELSTDDFGPFTKGARATLRCAYSYDYDTAYGDALKKIVEAGLTVVAINTNGRDKQDVFMCKWTTEEFAKLAILFKVKVD